MPTKELPYSGAGDINSVAPEVAPAVRCSYCGILIQDEEKEKMGFEASNWAICAEEFQKAFDKVADMEEKNT